MSPLLLHSPLLTNSSHRRVTRQVTLELGEDFTTEEEEARRREEKSGVFCGFRQRSAAKNLKTIYRRRRMETEITSPGARYLTQ